MEENMLCLNFFSDISKLMPIKVRASRGRGYIDSHPFKTSHMMLLFVLVGDLS